MLGGETPIGRVGLGTNRIGDGDAAAELLRGAVALGVTFVDTASLYTNGASERAIGAALGGDSSVVIATKGGYHDGSPVEIAAAIEQSRRNLRRDTLDLYYLHRPDPQIPIEQSLDPILAARQDGRVRHIGVSNVTLEQLDRARKLAPIAAVQNAYNCEAQDQDDVIEYCERHRIAFVAHSPLRDSRRAKKIAKRLGVPRTSVVIAALLARSPVVVAIPGSLRLTHIAANLAAAEITLTPEDLAELGFSARR